MLNRDGIRKTTLSAPTQILANVELQSSVGCRVPQAVGVEVGGSTIAKAGTPLRIDLEDLQTAAKEVKDTDALNAVLLHDVDVTNGTANGTALIFGFVNLNRIDSDTQTTLAAARKITGASPLITFLKI